MKFRVKLKTTVTGWAVVEISDTTLEQYRSELHDVGFDPREWAADDAVNEPGWVLTDPLTDAGLEHGPIELAYEELDESVEVVA